jgi:hypothetical protein
MFSEELESRSLVEDVLTPRPVFTSLGTKESEPSLDSTLSRSIKHGVLGPFSRVEGQ